MDQNPDSFLPADTNRDLRAFAAARTVCRMPLALAKASPHKALVVDQARLLPDRLVASQTDVQTTFGQMR